MKKLLARLYIIFFAGLAWGGSSIFGLIAGICSYLDLEHGNIFASIIMFLMLAFFMFIPIMLICGFALTDSEVFHNAEW